MGSPLRDHVTGRLGCFAAGCCYGKPTDVPWAVVFTNPLAAANVGTPLGIPLHPTQLYEAGAELLILILLLVTERRGKLFAGRTFWSYMMPCSLHPCLLSRLVTPYDAARNAIVVPKCESTRRLGGARHAQ